MTARLNKAIQQLPPDKIERVADFAESLVRQQGQPQQDEFLDLQWAGKAADAYPEHSSGVEAAHATAQMIRDALEPRPSK